jgi:hypothetical protein
MMRRRAFITLLGSAAATWPLGARAQPADPRIRSQSQSAASFSAIPISGNAPLMWISLLPLAMPIRVRSISILVMEAPAHRERSWLPTRIPLRAHTLRHSNVVRQPEGLPFLTATITVGGQND